MTVKRHFFVQYRLCSKFLNNKQDGEQDFIYLYSSFLPKADRIQSEHKHNLKILFWMCSDPREGLGTCWVSTLSKSWQQPWTHFFILVHIVHRVKFGTSPFLFSPHKAGEWFFTHNNSEGLPKTHEVLWNLCPLHSSSCLLFNVFHIDPSFYLIYHRPYSNWGFKRNFGHNQKTWPLIFIADRN